MRSVAPWLPVSTPSPLPGIRGPQPALQLWSPLPGHQMELASMAPSQRLDCSIVPGACPPSPWKSNESESSPQPALNILWLPFDFWACRVKGRAQALLISLPACSRAASPEQTKPARSERQATRPEKPGSLPGTHGQGAARMPQWPGSLALHSSGQAGALISARSPQRSAVLCRLRASCVLSEMGPQVNLCFSSHTA